MLINSYLNKRKFIVDCGGCVSESREVTAGVPQGSVLGPVLFIIFINDIPSVNDNKIALFADDTALINNSGNYNLLMKKSSEHYRLICEYFTKWKIKINNNKTEMLITSRKRRHVKYAMNDNRTSIHNNKYVRYLGVYIDANFDFSHHISQTVIKAKIAISILFRILSNKCVKTKIKLLLYKLCIKPIMFYSCPIWCNTSQYNLNKLQRVQNKCSNIILRNYRANVNFLKMDECHEVAQIERIEDVIDRLSKRFYEYRVNKIEIIKKNGINI